MNKELYIIAGPNGAGKTTFAINLIDEGLLEHFLNADELAKEFAASAPIQAETIAARKFLTAIKALSQAQKTFAFETTLSGRGYIKHIKRLKSEGWKVSLFYLLLSSAEASKQRVAERVAHGGHNIPADAIERRFPKSLLNFFYVFMPIVDYAECILNEGDEPISIFKAAKGKIVEKNDDLYSYLMELIKNAKKWRIQTKL